MDTVGDGQLMAVVFTVLNPLTPYTLYFFQVIINFPDPAQKSDIVQLRGPRTEVEKCAKFMQKIVAEMVNLLLIFHLKYFCLFKDCFNMAFIAM